MLYFLFPFVLSLSLIFSTLTHPLSMGVTLLVQTSLICLLSGLSSPSFWFSYILFLIFLGGLLIIFIYVASLASNEPFKLYFKSFSILLLLTLLSAFSLLTLLDPLISPSQVSLYAPSIFFNKNINPTLSATMMIYSSTSSPLTVLMILYLLFTLIVVVKIISVPASPLRPLASL
uniref:NADH-ubiquinone oxidoreductase chain 6 n=1 Tax=Ombrastacoides huonensis TaxID=217112 RepID=A0A411ATR2_9EUCA|nr:NADH dehydrogenase subunit 6 [Ombrastacoides huonensis]QAX91380.1 NADH dehydrogenase subunit 6 [Ombrastacoides huonensis]